RPFRVFAGRDEIRALGTAFDVRFEDGMARVILEEGKVAVIRGGARKEILRRRDDPLGVHQADVVRKPGEAAKLTAIASGPKVVEVELSKTNAWRDGEIVCDKVSVAAAVAEVNRDG